MNYENRPKRSSWDKTRNLKLMLLSKRQESEHKAQAYLERAEAAEKMLADIAEANRIHQEAANTPTPVSAPAAEPAAGQPSTAPTTN